MLYYTHINTLKPENLKCNLTFTSLHLLFDIYEKMFMSFITVLLFIYTKNISLRNLKGMRINNYKYRMTELNINLTFYTHVLLGTYNRYYFSRRSNIIQIGYWALSNILTRKQYW